GVAQPLHVLDELPYITCRPNRFGSGEFHLTARMLSDYWLLLGILAHSCSAIGAIGASSCQSLERYRPAVPDQRRSRNKRHRRHAVGNRWRGGVGDNGGGHL